METRVSASTGVRRWLAAALTTALLTTSLVLTSGASVAAQNGMVECTIRLANLNFQDFNSIHVGVEKGIFAEHGVTLEFIEATQDARYDLLLGGDIEVTGGGLTDVIFHNIAGFDTTVIVPFFEFAGSALMFDPTKFDWKGFPEVLAEQGGDRLAALKATLLQAEGAKIGAGKSGGEYFLFIKILDIAGLEESDFDVLDIPQEDTVAAAFGGSIDVMIGGIPQRFAALAEGYTSLVDQTAVPETMGGLGSWVATRSWVDANPECALQFMQGMYETLAFITANPDESFPIISDALRAVGTDLSVTQLSQLWNVMEVFVESQEDLVDRVISEDGRRYWLRDAEQQVETMSQVEDNPIDPAEVPPLEDLNYFLKLNDAWSEQEMTE